MNKETNTMSDVQKYRALIVEDKKRVAEKFQRALKSICESMIARDSTQAFEQIDDFAPHVILLDLVLEGDREYQAWEAGMRILERLRKQDSIYQDTPVIIVTGRIEREIEDRCRGLGVTEFFRKPIPLQTLRQAVKESLQKQQQTDADQNTK